MTEIHPASQMIQSSLINDKKVDAKEFKALQAEIIKEGITPEENKILMDALTQNQFTSDTVPSVIGFVASALEAKIPKKKETSSENKPISGKENPQKSASDPIKGTWKTKYEIQGSFNHTQVSEGWADQYGGEKNATKVEGSLETEVNYEKKGFAWNNKVRVEYGNTFIKGDKNTERAVSRDNLEATTEASRTLSDKGNWKIELPYASLYSKGPLTSLEGRKFRETTGAKATYTNEKSKSEFAIKVGAGLQQTHSPETQKWTTEAGVELIVEAKQSFGVFKAPIVSALGTKEENVTFLDRLEASASVNSFTPVHQGISADSTDVVIRTGARYYVNDNKSIWVGVNKEWQYGGQEESTWEDKFSGNMGFKFE